MALKSGRLDKETASFPRSSFTFFTSTSGIFDRVVEGWSWAIFCDPSITTSSSTLVAVWGESLVQVGGGGTSRSSRRGLAALADSSSMSSVVTVGFAVSQGGEGDFCCGELWPVAGSNNVALALKKKVARKVHIVIKKKRRHRKREKRRGVMCLPSIDLEVFWKLGHALI